jgi:hypothetical protein
MSSSIPRLEEYVLSNAWARRHGVQARVEARFATTLRQICIDPDSEFTGGP